MSRSRSSAGRPCRWKFHSDDKMRCDPVTLRRITIICATLVLVGAFLALGWVALAPITPREPSARELLYVIPKGAGGQSTVQATTLGLPSEIHLRLGIQDILVLRNDDAVRMQIGPVRLAPGQTYRLAFHQPGALQLACSFHQGIGFVIFVDPLPSPGWERLRWRLGWFGR